MVTQNNALRRLWKDAMTVIERHDITKPNGSAGFEEVRVLIDEPCKLSFSSLQAASQNGVNAAIVQVVKIFCDPALIIGAGSKLIVEHKGRTFIYRKSGEPGIFTNHQEIVLVPFKEWA